MPSEFTWTDELVKEYGEWIIHHPPTFASNPLILVEQFKQSKIKEKERIEVTKVWRASGGLSTLDGAPFNCYHFNSVTLIPTEKLPLIKQAIEGVLNGDPSSPEPEETKIKEWNVLDAEVTAPRQKLFVNGIEFVPQQSNNQPLSGELITKEECERQKREAFASARKIDEKYFLEMLRKDSYYPSEISTQHLKYKTFEDYQQSLK